MGSQKKLCQAIHTHAQVHTTFITYMDTPSDYTTLVVIKMVTQDLLNTDFLDRCGKVQLAKLTRASALRRP